MNDKKSEKKSIDSPPPIPGERDADTLTGSQTGTIGGGGFGAHNPSPIRGTGMDDETVHEHEKEGGGAKGERE